MRKLPIFLMLFLFACKQTPQKDVTQDSIAKIDSARIADSISNSEMIVSDTLLNTTARAILELVKAKDYYRLTEVIHPQKGLRFVTYGVADTTLQPLFAEDLLSLAKSKKPRKWGIYDGSGDPINLTLDKYMEKFVYDVDFLNADTSVNKIIGNTKLNNLQVLYPKSRYIQFYFQGVDPKYAGMDWKSLTMFFETHNTQLYLVALVHDQWKS